MCGFKSNSIGLTRKLVLSLGDAAVVTTDFGELIESAKRDAAGNPKKLRSMFESKEAQLGNAAAPVPSPKRQRSVATPSTATEQDQRRKSGMRRRSIDVEMLKILAEIFFVEEDATQKMRRRDACFSLIDVVVMVTKKHQHDAAHQIIIVQLKYP